VLGLGLAAAFAILNAMWFELDADRDALEPPPDAQHDSGASPN